MLFSWTEKQLKKNSLGIERKEVNTSPWLFLWVLFCFYEHSQKQGKRICESDLNPKSIHEKLLLNSEQRIPIQGTWFCKNRALFPSAFYSVRQNLYLCLSKGVFVRTNIEILSFSLPGLWPKRMNIVSIEIMRLNYSQFDFPETNIAWKWRGASFSWKKIETMTEFLRGTKKE